MAKTLSIEEFNVAAGSRSQMSATCASIIRNFVGSGDEAWELDNTDFGKPYGWLEKKNDGGGYQNCSYIKKVLVKQTEALRLDEIVEVRHIKGHVYLVRKEML